MRYELIGLLQNDLQAFVRKALRKLDDTVIDDDPYIELSNNAFVELRRRVNQDDFSINMPQRHAKTKICSICFSAWILAHNPASKDYDRDVLERPCRKHLKIHP